MSNLPLPITPAVPDITDVSVELCDTLAGLIGEQTGFTPVTTMGWRRDMRLLLEHGPIGTAKQPLNPSDVRDVLYGTFEHQTWWADKITDPRFLRKHYPRIYRAVADARPQVSEADQLAAMDQLRNL